MSWMWCPAPSLTLLPSSPWALEAKHPIKSPTSSLTKIKTRRSWSTSKPSRRCLKRAPTLTWAATKRYSLYRSNRTACSTKRVCSCRPPPVTGTLTDAYPSEAATQATSNSTCSSSTSSTKTEQHKNSIKRSRTPRSSTVEPSATSKRSNSRSEMSS